MAGVVLAGCAGTTKPTPSLPTPASSSSTAAPGPGQSAPEGFEAAIIEVTRADGTVESYCVWLATTKAERERGLMQVTTLGGADGMLFRFGVEQATSFWMKDTVLPLSVAYFTGAGRFVSSADMEPCPPASPACPSYPASAPYADALEVAQGDLGRLGITAGARLRTTGAACDPGG